MVICLISALCVAYVYFSEMVDNWRPVQLCTVQLTAAEKGKSREGVRQGCLRSSCAPTARRALRRVQAESREEWEVKRRRGRCFTGERETARICSSNLFLLPRVSSRPNQRRRQRGWRALSHLDAWCKSQGTLKEINMTSIKTILKNILSNYIKVPTVFGSIIGVYEPPCFTHLFYIFFLLEKTQT